MALGRSKQGRWRCWKAVLVRVRSWHNLVWKDKWEQRHKLWFHVCGEPLRMLSVQLRRWLLHQAEPLNCSCPSICPSNLPSILSLKKSFLRGCSRRSMLPHHGRLRLLRTEQTSCIDAPPNVISCSTYLQSAHSLSPQHTRQPCCLQCSEEVCSFRGTTTPVLTRKVHVENNGFLCCIVLVDFAIRYFN